MTADVLETLVNIPTYSAKVMLLDGDRLEVTSDFRSERSGAESYSSNLVTAQMHGSPTCWASRAATAQLRGNQRWRQ